VNEVARFVFTGALNTLVGYAIYAGLVYAGLAPAIALLVATVLGVLFNFVSFGTLTFRRLEARLLPRFLAAYVAIYVFNVILLEAVQRYAGAGPIVGQFLCLLLVAPAAYLLLKTQVYGGRAA
jgi:putative flippase GtrA